jgi:hypothetical protein
MVGHHIRQSNHHVDRMQDLLWKQYMVMKKSEGTCTSTQKAKFLPPHTENNSSEYLNLLDDKVDK